MGTDISEGAKVGIILIILCALIAIVFSLLTMMKNITSSGSQSLQNGLDQLGDSEFQAYDQKLYPVLMLQQLSRSLRVVLLHSLSTLQQTRKQQIRLLTCMVRS